MGEVFKFPGITRAPKADKEESNAAESTPVINLERNSLEFINGDVFRYFMNKLSTQIETYLPNLITSYYIKTLRHKSIEYLLASISSRARIDAMLSENPYKATAIYEILLMRVKRGDTNNEFKPYKTPKLVDEDSPPLRELYKRIISSVRQTSPEFLKADYSLLHAGPELAHLVMETRDKELYNWISKDINRLYILGRMEEEEA